MPRIKCIVLESNASLKDLNIIIWGHMTLADNLYYYKCFVSYYDNSAATMTTHLDTVSSWQQNLSFNKFSKDASNCPQIHYRRARKDRGSLEEPILGPN